jgi:DNA-binding NarL/FixJ family response regulator
MRKPRILIADDHKIVAEGLKSLLEPQFELVAIVQDGNALVAAAEEHKADIIIVDISMPLLNGVEAARQIKKKDKRATIIFLTMHPDIGYAVSAFEAGASGYVLKQAAASELILAINEVLKGRTYVTPVIEGELVEAYREMSKNRESLPHITPRQRQVLQLLTEGHSTKEIASLMNISRRTVEFHKYRVMDDLGIKNMADLIRYAIKHGFSSG